MAERVGFEPTRGLRPLRAFQARLIDHSSTSPRLCGHGIRRSLGMAPQVRGRTLPLYSKSPGVRLLTPVTVAESRNPQP